MIIIKPLMLTALRIVSFVVYFLTLCSAFGGYINPEIWALPSVGTLLLPFFGMATIVITAAWLFSRRFITGGIGLLTLLICITPLGQALPISLSNKAAPGARTFKMVSFNCTHLSDLRSPESTSARSVRFLLDTDADFAALAELYSLDVDGAHVGKEMLDSLKKKYPYQSKDGWRDVSLISKYPFRTLDVKLPTDLQFHSFGAYKIDLKGSELTVVVVHLPSYVLSGDEREILSNAKNMESAKESLREFKGTVLEKLERAFRIRGLVSQAIVEMLQDESGPVVICGDFNDVPASWCYRTFLKGGFSDAYAETSFGHLATFNKHMMYFHIDQILYRGALTPLYVRKSSMDASDHYPLVAEFAFGSKEK